MESFREKDSGDGNLKKMNAKSPSKSESTDWRMVGRSRERHSSSLRKKGENSMSSDTSQLSMSLNSTDQRSLSTRREMRGLMKAIDTASASSQDVTREKKELKCGEKQPPTRSSPKKLSSAEPSSTRRPEIIETSRRSSDEVVHDPSIHPVQSRQASAENSFIQRVRRLVVISHIHPNCA